MPDGATPAGMMGGGGGFRQLPIGAPNDSAAYIAELLVELRDLSGASGHTFLAYLIQVAVEEARLQSR